MKEKGKNIFLFARLTLQGLGSAHTPSTYMALTVQSVVGQLGVVEGDGATLPVGTRGWGVWVDEDPVGQPGLRTAHRLPATTLEAVARVVGRDDVQQEDVAEGRVEAGDL